MRSPTLYFNMEMIIILVYFTLLLIRTKGLFWHCSPHGIFHLSDPGGVSVIRNCQQRGFHPHEEPEDGTPIYEHCSHVYMNANLKFDVVDLRER